MQEVLNFLKDNSVFYLATVDEDQPRVRPFGAVMEFESKLYLCTNNQKDVFKQIQTNSRVEICGWDQKEQWLRIAGKLVLDSRKEAKSQMLAEYPALQDMYPLGSKIFEVLYFQEATATFYSFSGETKTLRF